MNLKCFNTQPPEGGWVSGEDAPFAKSMFQHTAARRRLGQTMKRRSWLTIVSTHSRPKAAGRAMLAKPAADKVSTHSRPKAAGLDRCARCYLYAWFQHTAARRRLASESKYFVPSGIVSTHSRPKAAGKYCISQGSASSCFNTQPPEGGWLNAR